MNTQLFQRFSKQITRYSPGMQLPTELLISEGPAGLQTFYAPFDYININAKLVICGLTPGLQQANAALGSASMMLNQNYKIDEILRSAKATASFAGVMRANISAMLDHIGVNRLLDIPHCSDLFASNSKLVHYTSALRYPVLKAGKNYAGDKKIIEEEYLWNQCEEYLQEELRTLNKAIWIPLGKAASDALMKLNKQNLICDDQILYGLPHASGANIERIHYFLGLKSKNDISTKVNPDLIDNRKKSLLSKIHRLLSQG